MLKILDKETIIEAIDWFFDHDYWGNKIKSMTTVERCMHHFMSDRKKGGTSEGSLTKKLKTMST